ncbi:hypothetical protein HYX58_01000 [Candidatus Dependentiae bacterium]|nr:hypothetical protein [Candidatus Dependentiae bacterium]
MKKYLLIALLAHLSIALQAMNKEFFTKEQIELIDKQTPIADFLNQCSMGEAVDRFGYTLSTEIIQGKKFHQLAHKEQGIFLLPIQESAPDYFKYTYKGASNWQPRLIVEFQLFDKALHVKLAKLPWTQRIAPMVVSYAENPDKLHYETWFRAVKGITGLAFIASSSYGLLKYFSGEPTVLANPIVSFPALYAGIYLTAAAAKPNASFNKKILFTSALAPAGSGVLYLANNYRHK